MRTRLKLFRNLSLAAGIAVALMFGATQALADSPCTPLPPHTCPSPDDCIEVCQNNGYPFGGDCLVGLACCICLEK